jgi:hypothetical protein
MSVCTHSTITEVKFSGLYNSYMMVMNPVIVLFRQTNGTWWQENPHCCHAAKFTALWWPENVYGYHDHWSQNKSSEMVGYPQLIAFWPTWFHCDGLKLCIATVLTTTVISLMAGHNAAVRYDISVAWEWIWAQVPLQTVPTSIALSSPVICPGRSTSSARWQVNQPPGSPSMLPELLVARCAAKGMHTAIEPRRLKWLA